MWAWAVKMRSVLAELQAMDDILEEKRPQHKKNARNLHTRHQTLLSSVIFGFEYADNTKTGCSSIGHHTEARRRSKETFQNSFSVSGHYTMSQPRDIHCVQGLVFCAVYAHPCQGVALGSGSKIRSIWGEGGATGCCFTLLTISDLRTEVYEMTVPSSRSTL